jgi:hypothetical protein
LGFVDWQDFFYAFQLNNYFFMNDQVEAISAVEFEAFVFDRQVDLATEIDAAKVEFVA